MHGDNGAGPASGWTRQQDKKLEELFVEYNRRWDLIAAHFPDKTPAQLRERFEYTLAEGGRILETLPESDDPHPAPAGGEEAAACAPTGLLQTSTGGEILVDGMTSKKSMPASKVKKATPPEKPPDELPDVKKVRKNYEKWTEDEHREFLRGVEKWGRNWKQISLEFVKTRTAREISNHFHGPARRQARKLGIDDMATMKMPDHDGEPAAAAVCDESETGRNGGLETDDVKKVRKSYQKWTDDEHREFLRGVEKWGRKWKLISQELVCADQDGEGDCQPLPRTRLPAGKQTRNRQHGNHEDARSRW